MNIEQYFMIYFSSRHSTSSVGISSMMKQYSLSHNKNGNIHSECSNSQSIYFKSNCNNCNKSSSICTCSISIITLIISKHKKRLIFDWFFFYRKGCNILSFKYWCHQHNCMNSFKSHLSCNKLNNNQN